MDTTNVVTRPKGAFIPDESCSSSRSDASTLPSKSEKKHKKCYTKHRTPVSKKARGMKDERPGGKRSRILSASSPAKTPSSSRCSRPWTQSAQPSSSISRLCLRGLEVDFPSAFDSHSLTSDVDPGLDSLYIYAESIKGCDSSCSTFPGDYHSFCHKPSRDFSSVCDAAGLHLDAVDLYVSCGKCSDSDYMEAHRLHGLQEEEWRSRASGLISSSESSCYTPDQDSESSYCDSFSKYHQDNEMFVPDFEERLDFSEAGTLGRIEGDGLKAADTCSGLRTRLCEPGWVMQSECQNFPASFCEMIKKALLEKDKADVNEGFLFHPKQFLQTRKSKYQEGREYSLLRHIQNGSYGDVFSIRDKQTGFTCAAKKIPLSSFRCEEVEAWSRLDSPRVLQLYGAVREGPNIVLFMDLKRGSLAQLLRVKGRLSEGVALYYLSQVLQALQHLHSRHVAHLDVKVDNVLLTKDGRQCFLCDFGLSETLDQRGFSTKTFRGSVLRGTETHMPPEVARGDACSAKADVWSSCCMLLHMLNGHQPWTRYYPHPLYLKIVSEPPPLWEISPDCDPLTCDVIRGGLVKEPKERHSASELLEKSIRAFRAVCGLSCASYDQHPTLTFEDCPHLSLSEISIQPHLLKIPEPEDASSSPILQWVSQWREIAKNEDDWDSSAGDSSEEIRWDEDHDRMESDRMRWMEKENSDHGLDGITHQVNTEESREQDGSICGASADLPRERRGLFGDPEDDDRHLSEDSDDGDEDEARSIVSDEEVQSDLGSLREMSSEWTRGEWEPFLHLQTLYLGREVAKEDSYSESEDESDQQKEPKGTSLDDRTGPQALTSTSCRDSDFTDKDSDDFSSGVFSSCVSGDEQSLNVDWSVSTNQPPSCFFEGLGVDIWLEDVSGESFKIRERPLVKIGHVAVGISEQISMKAFSLATLDGRLISPDTEVCESGLWLQCVPAPDSNPWDWRVRDGKLEVQEYNELYVDSCSTVAL